MILRRAPRIEPLGDHHDRSTFSCGERTLNTYIRRQAGQDVRRGVSKVFVAALDDPASIAGFYSLSATALQARSLPSELARKLPRHPQRAALIGRLAVDRRHRHRGLGKYLLMDALARSVAASVSIGISAVVVDAPDENVREFCAKYGLRRVPDAPNRLFIPLGTIVSQAE